VRVRYRIDGLLREVTVVPKPIQGPLISRVKILSGMDISERRKPQDGRGRIRLDRQEADTRVSSMPTMHGETVVIRLLRKEAEKAKSLRQDPDIVMVGEIRDPETAAIAMQASMTGHLVLSTLHTNDAPSAVSRLRAAWACSRCSR
jgi:type II secretory ATPase GspE/PulE/Tfp pilus assembly ATPase PilB-like protein